MKIMRLFQHYPLFFMVILLTLPLSSLALNKADYCQLFNDEFSIKEQDAVFEAIEQAEKIILEHYKQWGPDQAQQLYNALHSVVDQIACGTLTAHVHDLLLPNRSNMQEEDIARGCCEKLSCTSDIIKVRDKLYVFESAKFFKDVEIKKDLTVEGTAQLSDAEIGCNLTVGCNINMNNSISSSVGNIIKNGTRFIHNFGPDNTFVGLNAGNFSMVGFGNTGVGSQALQSNINGLGNTAFGYLTLIANVSGSGNIAVGPLALTASNGGFINTATGTLSMQSNTTGSSNCAYGFFTLSSNTIGNDNTAIGTGSLSTNTTGNGNTALGISSLMNNITGSRNVVIGNNAGFNLISGDDNIYITNTGVLSENGAIRIGTLGTHTASFIQGIFGSTVGLSGLPVEVDAAGQLGTVVSSVRFKKNIEDLAIGSEKIYNLHPVQFSYKSDEKDSLHYGLIAEEVAEVFPELIVYDADGAPYSVRYQVLPVLLLNEVQKQQKELQAHHAIIAALAKRVALLEKNAPAA